MQLEMDAVAEPSVGGRPAVGVLRVARQSPAGSSCPCRAAASRLSQGPDLPFEHGWLPASKSDACCSHRCPCAWCSLPIRVHRSVMVSLRHLVAARVPEAPG